MKNNASLQPAWIVRRDERKAQAATRAKLLVAEESLAEAMIREHSPQFCSDFLMALRFNFDSIPGFDGIIKPIATPDNGPHVYMVTLRGKPPLRRSISGTIQFNQPYASTIRFLPVSPEGMKGWSIGLAPLPSRDSIGGLWSEYVLPLNAMRIAELVAEAMVDCIDSQ